MGGDELMRGDHRLLYLLWLLKIQTEEVDVNETEPPVPPGLRDLSLAQRVFCDVMRIDRNLVDTAAECSGPIPPEASPQGIGAWLRGLPAGERDAWLERVLAGEAKVVQAEILTRYRDVKKLVARPMTAPRMVAALWDAADIRSVPTRG